MEKFTKKKEGAVEVFLPSESKVSKDLPVFYNPVMEYNRTLSIALLNALDEKDLQLAFPLSGTGVRGIRFIRELKKGIIKKVYFNDIDEEAAKLIKKNLALNNISKTRPGIEIHNKDANQFLLEGKGFDYIDIDPFGSPNKFLNNAIERLSRGGILAVTATDTGALCGTYKDACLRKYWAIPMHTEEMHEIGLRILIRKVQLVGTQFEKALIPMLSYDKDHYMRVFFRCIKAKKDCDRVLQKHEHYRSAGPIWTGELCDKKIIRKIDLDDKFTRLLKDEINALGFYDIPSLIKKHKIKKQKKIDQILKEIKRSGYRASRTHFSLQGIKTNMPLEQMLHILNN